MSLGADASHGDGVPSSDDVLFGDDVSRGDGAARGDGASLGDDVSPGGDNSNSDWVRSSSFGGWVLRVWVWRVWAWRSRSIGSGLEVWVCGSGSECFHLEGLGLDGFVLGPQGFVSVAYGSGRSVRVLARGVKVRAWV